MAMQFDKMILGNVGRLSEPGTEHHGEEGLTTVTKHYQSHMISIIKKRVELHCVWGPLKVAYGLLALSTRDVTSSGSSHAQLIAESGLITRAKLQQIDSTSEGNKS